MKRHSLVRLLSLSLTLGLAWTMRSVLPAAEKNSTAPPDTARAILEAAGVRGGLIVHLGCGDGKLTAALGASDAYLVEGLDTDAGNVGEARRHIQSLGLYGRVAVGRLEGKRLPYVDNLVNLVVAERPGDIAMDELLRVLAPEGVAYVKKDGRWTKTVKPRPAEIDEWTHFLHDASNNAVSDDSVVGPPRQLQWVGGPRWARSHDHLATLSAAVASGGRLFYVIDEAPIAAVVLEPKWSLVARDAFSGVVLWKRPIPKWEWHLRGFRSGPSDLSRRLVAVGSRVYVTLGIDAPLSALDAVTGETLTTYEGTGGTLEVVFHSGTLFVVAGDAVELAAAKALRRGERPGFAEVRPQRPAYPEPPPRKRLMAIDAETGRLLWKKSDADTAELMPTTLAVGDGRVFFQNADEVLALDALAGSEIWRASRTVSRTRPTWSAPTLVVYGDVVLSGDRAVAERKTEAKDEQGKVEWIVSSAGGRSPVGELIAFSADSGKRLWQSTCRECYNAPVDVLVADGLVWTGDIVRAKDPGVTQGLDPKTGEVKRTRPKDETFFTAGMGHQRCYRNKATNRYLVFGRSGTEFIDLATGEAFPHHWTRGTCQYGVIPSNGLLYVPSNSCACFLQSKLDGFHCLAPKRPSQPVAASKAALGAGLPTPPGNVARSGDRPQRVAVSEANRLQRGPAYDSQPSRPSTLAPLPFDWPTYRHDSARSGSTKSPVPAELKPAWHADLGGKLTSVVVAEGKLFVAQVDAHTVHALDAEDGRPIWTFTAGSRVDSPPTVFEGRVLFGSADGWVYCLRAKDGVLAWRFLAAPDDLRIVAYGQIESLWPVPGSVLVREGVAYATAGRSSYLDGGIRLVRLDVKTGQKLSETLVDHRDPETGFQRKDSVRGTTMPGALPDVLSCDGESIFMRHTRFDLAGQPQEPTVPHLYSAVGFLDDTWWHRAYWMLGSRMATNYGGWPQVGNRVPAGRILAMDEASIYGFGRNQYIHHGAHVGIDGATVFHFNPKRDAERRFTQYRAFAIDRPLPPGNAAEKKPAGARRRPATPPKKHRWTEELPILARAIVLAQENLFLAGPPDFLASDDPAGAFQGGEGGSLVVVSTEDGSKRAKYELENPPVFDGMAAAGGRLYLATTGGEVLCFGSEK